MKAQLLITSLLDERWTDVDLEIDRNEIEVYRYGGDFVVKNESHRLQNRNKNRNIHNPNERTKLHTINGNNITGIVKDSDNQTLRIDCKTNINNIAGYYLIKLMKLENYYELIKYLELSNSFRNIIWSNRTYELDKKMKI